MKSNFKKKLKKLLGYISLLFVALFIFRLAYGYTKKLEDTSPYLTNINSFTMTNRNFASKKYEVKASTNQGVMKVDQKYEKIAQISTKSTDFEKEEQQSRAKIQELEALIQFEQKSGNKGYRSLSLVIGVPPENFDALYAELIKIGKVDEKQITKKDKTNEYKELNAKKHSLEKIRTSLIELKSKGGKIEEYMGLENRILDIEQQLQDLGVSLGDFDDENEFCTVQFSLQEGKEVTISFFQRVKVALDWTIKAFLKLMFSAVLMVIFSYLVLLLIEKLKVLEKLVGKGS
ncbi:conserved hypothetical protein [Tenacibaculum litopenaei]|uniref:DUF4349 domain-containing protein n=1 Tax=Tenacibaculum litopenaei TaxID=396016 RepID=UPI003892DB49